MPVDPDTGMLRPFNDDEIDAMQIRTFGVRDMSHGTETRRIGENTMRKSFFVKWSERFNFVKLVCGDQKIYVDSGFTKLSRMIPDEIYGIHHPDFPEIVATRIDNMKGANGPGIDDEDGIVKYPDAQIDVFYEHVPYDLLSDDEVADEDGNEFLRYTHFGGSTGSAQNISVPGGAMRYWRGPGEGTAPPHGFQVPYGVSISRAEEEFTWHWVQLPYEAFKPGSNLYARIYGTVEGDLPFIGCVNSSPIFDRAVGTVVFAGVTAKLERAHSGQGRRWSLEYKFAYSAMGWNWLFFPDPSGVNGGWYNVNNKEYQEADVLDDHRSLTPGARDLNMLFSVAAV
ncbi:hypothetical protein VT84_24410 [Gemmata sp. SH-PL17]|uniref:hypothetical protein n=1 Tax=Gemmata sp. SH-PL17 TaxID=1630693 RepID=UPI00078EBD4E|nr:hypothetical protein [Gemmata sp. SH-PL17]AMV27567.1 hypothetical protein VT84_24410 [Gemmata sp. SH-PL17]